MPKWYLDRPEIPAGTAFIVSAYWDLDTDRSPDGMIKWAVAREWFEVGGYLENVWPIFWDAIKEIDLGFRLDRARVTRNK